MPSRLTSTKALKLLVPILIVIVGIWVFRSPFFSAQLDGPENQIEKAPATLVLEKGAKSAELDSVKTSDVSLETPEAPVSPAVQAKVKLLKEILLTKNDNDPRIDSEFKSLSPELKQELQKTYRQFPKESLNERGTVLFVLAKDLSETKDLAIFNEVLMEPVCLSFANCKASSVDAHDDHLDSANEASLLYPQLVALNRIENLIHKADFLSHTDDYIREVRELLQNASQSKEPRVQRKAQSLLDELTRLRR